MWHGVSSDLAFYECLQVGEQLCLGLAASIHFQRDIRKDTVTIQVMGIRHNGTFRHQMMFILCVAKSNINLKKRPSIQNNSPVHPLLQLFRFDVR